MRSPIARIVSISCLLSTPLVASLDAPLFEEPPRPFAPDMAYGCYEALAEHPSLLTRSLACIQDPNLPLSLRRPLLFALMALQNPPPILEQTAIHLLQNSKDPELLPWLILSLSSWRGAPHWPQRFHFPKNALYVKTTPEGLSIALREPLSESLAKAVLPYLDNEETSLAALETLRFSLNTAAVRAAFLKKLQDPQEEGLLATEALCLWLNAQPQQDGSQVIDRLIENAALPGAHAFRLIVEGYLYGQPLSSENKDRLLDFLSLQQEYTLRSFALKLLEGSMAAGDASLVPLFMAMALKDPHPKIRQKACKALGRGLRGACAP